MIETNASQTGWGAQCGNLQTGGPWFLQEALMHINCLELLAATLAIHTFAKKQDSLLIHLKMDSTSALTCINKMGGTVSPELNRLTKGARQGISPSMPHIFLALSTRKRTNQGSWKMGRTGGSAPGTFHKVQAQFGSMEIDLFASRLTNQLPTYVSWRPDPESVQTDAFLMNWKAPKAYANPPGTWSPKSWANEVRQQEATIVLVAPVWNTQAWYALLLEVLIKEPLLLPWTADLTQPTHPVNRPSLKHHLVAWYISGHDSLQKRISPQASSLVLASWREKSAKTYKLPFRKWAGWCTERDIDPISGDVASVVNFLADLFHQAYQHRSLCSYRSAIPSVHKKLMDSQSVHIRWCPGSLKALSTKDCLNLNTQRHRTSQ